MKLNRNELTVLGVALLGSLAAVALALFLLPMLGTAIGALTGLVVGIAFNDTYAAVAQRLGIDLPLWQVGAALGFLSTFFRPRVNLSKPKPSVD